MKTNKFLNTTVDKEPMYIKEEKITTNGEGKGER